MPKPEIGQPPQHATAQDYDPEPDTYRNCVAKYCYEDEFLVELTPEEQERLDHLKARMARIIADAGMRMEAKQAQEATREEFRRQQCVLPLLWLGCPSKAGT